MSQDPKEYEKIRAVWYQKLKDEGFEDIEGNEDNLKEWSAKRALENPPEIWQARAAYYHMATKFLNEFKFENSLEQTIWEYHAEGIPCRKIAATLAKAGIKKHSHWTVFTKIQRLERIMKTMYLVGYRESNE